MKAIILAGGRATRLPNSAKEIPKVLVEINGKPVLQHQIDLLASHGIFDIRLALGHKPDQIISYLGGKYEYVIEKEPLGTGGAIAYAVRGVGEPFFVLNGDILSNIDFTKFKEEFDSAHQEHMIAIWHTDDARSFGLVQHAGGSVREFREKPEEKIAGHINMGVYLLSPNAFLGMKDKKFSIERDIFPKLVTKNNLGAFVHDGWWDEMGTEERLANIRKRSAESR